MERRRAGRTGGALTRVRARIADAAARPGATRASITLIAVTKTYPAADVATLGRLGVADVGESRDQEARAKVDEVDRLLRGPPAPPVLRWHFVGRLQSTQGPRGGRATPHAVHSVDRTELVDGAGRRGGRASDRRRRWRCSSR